MSPISEQIDQYKILAKIGEGGMGEVYRGHDDNLDRAVALKFLRPELSSRVDVVTRFHTEAKALAKLNHQHIAAIYHFGRVDDQLYMALEFVNGETLDELIKKVGALSCHAAVHYAIAILEGLEHAHDLNIIHRDIKPSNIMITTRHRSTGDMRPRSAPKILDFGIAKILGDASPTKTGQLIGSLPYAPPEQLKSQTIDARSDIYAVGAVLYEMLTGHTPFEKDTEYDLISAHIQETPKSLRLYSSQISSVLDKVVLKALEKKPEHRFASALEFSNALRQSAGETVPTEPFIPKLLNKVKPLKVFCKTYPGVVLFMAMAVASSGYFLWYSHSQASRPTAVTVKEPVIGGLNQNIKVAEQSDSDPVKQCTQHELGEGVPKDILEAISCYKKQAELGNSQAQFKLGRMFELGENVTQDFEQAAFWYQKAVAQGQSDAQAYLGILYEQGTGVAQDIDQAVKLYRQSAEQGNGLGQAYLGTMYENGTGVPKDDSKAFELYKQSANQGNPYGQAYLGLQYENATASLSIMYKNSTNITKDIAKAVELYQKSAEQGNLLGQAYLGVMYENGTGVPKDNSKAFELYQKSADQNYSLAQSRLGDMYYHGKSVKKSYELAYQWFQKAADQGDSQGQYNLGYLYEYGQYVTRNHAKARSWYQKAAEQGHEEAKEALKRLKQHR